MRAAQIGRLQLNERLAKKHAIAIENLPPRLNQLLEPQVERTVEIAEVGAPQRIESLDWIGHASLSPVIARISRNIAGVTPRNEILLPSLSNSGSKPEQSTSAREMSVGGKS